MNCVQQPNSVRASLLDRRRTEHQNLSDRILLRSEWLEPSDRALIVSLYCDQVPLTRLASMRGESPRQTRRRVRRLIERLLAPRTSFIIARRREWDRQRWQVARKHLIAGCGLISTANELGLTVHTVRKHVEAVRTLHDELAAQANSTREAAGS